MTIKKSKPELSRWRVVWAVEHAHGRTNGVDFVDAIDAEAAGLMVAMAHPKAVITYIARDTRDPTPTKRKATP